MGEYNSIKNKTKTKLKFEKKFTSSDHRCHYLTNDDVTAFVLTGSRHKKVQKNAYLLWHDLDLVLER